MRFALALLAGSSLLLGATAAVPSRTAVARPASVEARFAAIGQRYVQGIARFAPSSGTTLGDHRFDSQLDDVSAAGRARLLAHDKALLGALGSIDRKALSRESQVDAALLDNALRYKIWQIETLRSWSWDPQIYNGIAGGALYGLAARDFAPWPQRLKAATARMEAMPAFFAQARAQLVPTAVPSIYASTVAKQNSGVLDIAETMLAPHADTLSAPDRRRFTAALATLKRAVAEHQQWLDTVLVPQAKGELRLGTKRYDQKMAFALVSTLSRQEIKARATAAVTDTRAQMYALARQVLAGKADAPALPDQPSAAQRQAAIEAALALTYRERPARDGVMAKARATLAQATDFVRAKGLVSVPDSPVKIITIPKFRQGVAVAYCDSPGALERQLDTLFAISPIPDEWSEAQANSFLSEYNDYMIHDLSIHEAMPGHYLQIAHANQNHSVLRAVLSSGPFVEGWAVYAEGMMADAGYLNDDPLFKLTVLKMRLRSITNALLDIGIHTEGMTREQAMALMTKTAFQQEREAAGKWTRASLGSTQLLSYFTGYAEHMAMRDEAKRRFGARFDLKTYNDAVLAHGSPPARFVRELVFDLPIG
jgi:uncharacterized protein (DUF885 family)